MTTYYGESTASVPGIEGYSTQTSILAIKAIATNYYAIYGQSNNGSSAGVYGYNNGGSGGFGVAAVSTAGPGLYAQGASGYSAVWSYGRLDVTGNANVYENLYVSGNLDVSGDKDFVIDHPLDPANKELVHHCVESCDRKNIYDGMGAADGAGEISIQLPAYFEVLNTDVCYQLTPVGGAAVGLYIKQEVSGGRFIIAGAKPGQKICWQITGTRNDAFAKANRFVVERDKTADLKGFFHHPEVHGEAADRGIAAALQRRLSAPQPVTVP